MRSFLGKTNLSITLLNKYIINHNMIIICIHIFHCVNDIINEIDTQCLSHILYLSLYQLHIKFKPSQLSKRYL